ncbi:hypothetical protein ACHWQZ_G012973 [Mnemiopsis leidyi]
MFCQLYLWFYTALSFVNPGTTVSINYDLHEEVDASTDYVVIPNLGLQFTREGTIFAHPQINLMTAIVTLNPLAYPNTQENRICREALWSVERKFNSTMQKYKEITEAIFEAKNIFTTDEICQIFETNFTRTNEHFQSVCPNYKQPAGSKHKRFVGLGAYVAAGAAVATATAALGLSTHNKVEINKIKNYLEAQEEQIFELQQQFKKTQGQLDVVLDTQNSILGYLNEMTVQMDDLNSKVDCMFKHFTYLQWAEELKGEVENLLQFIFAGNTYGRLTPSLINPTLLKQFIDQQSQSNSKILSQFPNMLYQSGTASILNADFENLQFTFLITYPNFGNDPIYPYLTMAQNGFYAKIPDTQELKCFQFDMPHTAVIHKNRLHALTKRLNCPSFGNVHICSKDTFNLIPMSECLDLSNRVSTNSTSNSNTSNQARCPLVPCIGNLANPNSYISSPPGLLVRTLASTIDVVYDQPTHQLDLYVSAMLKTIPTPPSKSQFISWNHNVSAVTFDKTVVYSPVNANHLVRLTLSTNHEIITLNPNVLFSVPQLGTEKINAIIDAQEARLQNLESQFSPIGSVAQWASNKFTLPLWLRILCYTTFVIGAATVIKFCHTFITKPKSRPSCFQNISSDQHSYSSLDRMPRMTENTLYPTLPTLSTAHVHNTVSASANRVLTPIPEIQTEPITATAPPQNQ